MSSSEFARDQDKLLIELRKQQLPSNITRSIAKNRTFFGAIISGDRRSGKSMYMLQSLYFLYNRNWDEAFKHMFFSMEEFTKYLQDVMDTGIRVPALGIDDAGVHFGVNEYSIHRNQVTHLTAMLDTIGILTNAIMLTVPSPGNLIKAIREANFLHINITLGQHEHDRIATAYSHKLSPKGQDITKRVFVDKYDVRVPDAIYDRYAEIRKSYSKETIANMNPYLKKPKLYKIGNAKYADIELGYG